MAYVKNGFLIVNGPVSEICIFIGNITAISFDSDRSKCLIFTNVNDDGGWIVKESYEEIKHALGIEQ